MADLKARRLELTRASVREYLVSGDFLDVRVVVESLAEEFDVLDVAAAAVKMAHTVTARGDEEELEAPPRREDRGAAARGADRKSPRRAPRAHHGNGARLFIGAGRRAGIRPADLVGAITGEAGVPARALGAIEIADSFSLVEVPGELADEIVTAMKGASLRGQKITIRRERAGHQR